MRLSIQFKNKLHNELIQQYFSDSKVIQKRIIEILEMEDDKFFDEFTNKLLYDYGFHNVDDNDHMYYKFIIIHKMLGFFDVEGDGNRYIWLNSGDSYNLTLIYDYKTNKCLIKCIGDLKIKCQCD